MVVGFIRYPFGLKPILSSGYLHPDLKVGATQEDDQKDICGNLQNQRHQRANAKGGELKK
jgi:hypothetical protein